MLLLCMVSCANSAADSWSVTQNVITSDTTVLLTQEGGNASVQSANLINLNQNNGVATNTHQTVDATGKNVTLSMTGGDNNTQALNYLVASEITNATQTVSNVDTVLLTQNGGNNNLQALNVANAKGAVGLQIQNLTQTVDAGTVTLDAQGSGENNIQAGNYIQADSISNIAGDVTQNFTATALNFAQSGNNNLQAGNVVIKNNASSTGVVTQNFTVGNLNANYSDTNLVSGSVRAANFYAERP